jgi:hypothetical protein
MFVFQHSKSFHQLQFLNLGMKSALPSSKLSQPKITLLKPLLQSV